MNKVMMKTVLASLVVSSITVLTGCVTSPDMEAAKQPLGSIVSVVNVPGVKKDALYSSSKIWVAKAFTDSNSVIQYADKEEGSIVGKGMLNTHVTVLMIVWLMKMFDINSL
jgi:hypothetical protein